VPTPNPYSPSWRITLAPITRQGTGLISPDLVQYKNNFDEFRVFCGEFELAIKPKFGQIFADSSLVVTLPTPCKLLWFRRNQFSLATCDHNHTTPDCICYGLGLENKNRRYGCFIKSDYSIQWGNLN
jgi:hypothetical protein